MFNNGALGFVELEQKSTGFLDFGTGPSRTRTSPPWPRPSASAASGSRMPAEVEAGNRRCSWRMTARFSSMPSSTGRSSPCRRRSPLEMAKGFTLYMVKAVMSGRGDEVIDLAKTNLWR